MRRGLWIRVRYSATRRHRMSEHVRSRTSVAWFCGAGEKRNIIHAASSEKCPGRCPDPETARCRTSIAMADTISGPHCMRSSISWPRHPLTSKDCITETNWRTDRQTGCSMYYSLVEGRPHYNGRDVPAAGRLAWRLNDRFMSLPDSVRGQIWYDRWLHLATTSSCSSLDRRQSADC